MKGSTATMSDIFTYSTLYREINSNTAITASPRCQGEKLKTNITQAN